MHVVAANLLAKGRQGFAHGFDRKRGQCLVQVAPGNAGLVGRWHATYVLRRLALDKVAHQLARRVVVAPAQHIGLGFELALEHDA